MQGSLERGCKGEGRLGRGYGHTGKDKAVKAKTMSVSEVTL